jgi:hypothetical protein
MEDGGQEYSWIFDAAGCNNTQDRTIPLHKAFVILLRESHAQGRPALFVRIHLN